MEIGNIKNTVIQGDCLDILPQLKSNTIDLVITSPPYYKQREYYGIGIGNEQFESEYLNNIIDVFNECVRVVKNSGAIVFNLGDKYEDSGLRLIPQRFAIRVIDRITIFDIVKKSKKITIERYYILTTCKDNFKEKLIEWKMI